MLDINTESKSYAKWTSKIRRSLRPARTQLSTISYVLKRLAKAQSTISDPTKFTKPIERETLGSGQVESTTHPAKLEPQTRKSITKTEGGETQTLGQISTKLNQTGGGWNIHHKDWEGKLHPSSGVLWAPHKPTNNKSILQTRKVGPSSSHWRDIKTRPRTPNDRQGNHGWVDKDQTTHFQGYAQAPRPCKRQIETPSSISHKP